MPMLTGKARVAGIVGWPVSHSRSPRLHGYWLERHAIDGAYIPLPVQSEDFGEAIRGLQRAGLKGVNVTIPHKVAAFELCDIVDSSAQRAGAVNTLTFSNGQITGFNTDGWGFSANLRGVAVRDAFGPVLILGAGGAARAIAAALLDAGWSVSITNRTPERAERLVRDLPGLGMLPWSTRQDALRDVGLLVNATSLGMAGHAPLELSLDRAPSALTVCDIVYTPLETPLLAAARANGLKAVDGLGMLLHQAVPGFRAWFGIEPQVDDEVRQFVAKDLIGG